MNFTPELSAFQGSILSADNVCQFKRLTSKGGNEVDVNFVVGSISSYLERSQYLVNGKLSTTSEVRTLALYLVLNSDLPVLQQLAESDEISTLIWTTPTIPKYLLSELMWNLHMEKFISEVISFANPQLALEVAGAFIENFKYFNPLDCLEQLQLLSAASYTLLCRLHLFNFDANELERKSTEAFKNFQQCLKYYTTPPNNIRLSLLERDDLYKYQGRSLYSLLQLIDKCLSQYTSKLDMSPPGYAVYKLTFVEESLKKDHPTFDICESTEKVLLDCLNNANTELLDACKVLVMDVSVDVFCCWSEFEENNKSMQQTVGELCYTVRNRLLHLNTLADHILVSMFEEISCKPVEMKVKINATENDVIVQNINNNDEESKMWIQALVFKEKLCQNSQLLNIVSANLGVYNEEEAHQLYLIFKKHISYDPENKDYVESLSVKVFEKCSLLKKYDILEEQFRNKIFIDMKKTPEFKNAMTSIFNKLIASPDADLTDVLTLFLQSPGQVFYRIFHLAAENKHQTQIMLKVVKLLKNFSDHYYITETETCVIQIIQKIFEELDTEAKQNNYIKFICDLKNIKFIPGTKLLLLVIMTNVHRALLTKDIGSMNVQIKLLREAFEVEELMEYRAPMLAMVAQVLDIVRWNIETFTAISPATLKLALDLQTSLLETYDGEIPDDQSEWLMSKLNNIHPLNMYYYRVLWDPPGSNYLEIVSGLTTAHDMSINDLTTWLSQVICSCSQQEWCELWDSLEVFDNSMILNILHASMAMVVIAEKAGRNENSWACVVNCYRNFLFITRYKFLAESITEVQVQSILSKAAMIAELVKADNIEEFGTLLMPLFAYLTEKQHTYNYDFVDCLHRHLARSKLAPMINRVFINGTA